MPLKNQLSLHEAIVVALINQPTRTASFDDIAKFIEDRKLYPERKGKISLATQVMLRSTKAKGAYLHMFEEYGKDFIRLRDSYNNLSIIIFNALEAILDHDKAFYHPPVCQLNVIDISINERRKIEISPEKVVCIITKKIPGNKTAKTKTSGRKKFIYLKEIDSAGKEVIGIYSIHENLENLKNKIDPLKYFLATISESALVNVGWFKLLVNKELKSALTFKVIKGLPPIKFLKGNTTKLLIENFELMQKNFNYRISLHKKAVDYISNPILA